MRAVRNVGAIAVLGVFLLVSGCGSRTPAAAIRPQPTTAASAFGEKSCRVPEDRARPLVIDWKSHHRADLEIAMRDGIVVAEYTCDSLRVLPHCHAKGRYNYVGVTSKEEVLSLHNADEMRAALPRTGPLLATRLEGEFARGSSFDVAMVLVGKQTSERKYVGKYELYGDCAGATHFVRSATLGAFATDVVTSGRVRGVAEIFGGGTGAASVSELGHRTRDGVLDSCRRASPSDRSAPEQCGALLRLELAELEREPPVVMMSAPPTPPPAPATVAAPMPARSPAPSTVAPAAAPMQARSLAPLPPPSAPPARPAQNEETLARLRRACLANDAVACGDWASLGKQLGHSRPIITELSIQCGFGHRASCVGLSAYRR